MNQVFRDHVASLEPALGKLLAMTPVKLNQLPKGMPECGVYLFSEGQRHLYAGRSNGIRKRLRAHASKSHEKAAFAFLLARKATGRLNASYRAHGSRSALLRDPEFAAAFHEACARIAQMDIRFVQEADPTRQALLEIFVATELETPYNNFDTH